VSSRIVHLDIGLGEEAEDLGQEISFRFRQVLVPVLDVVGERDLLGQPMDALLSEPSFIGPRVAEGLVDRVFGEKVGFHDRRALGDLPRINDCWWSG
jgi:hypothetical protein